MPAEVYVHHKMNVCARLYVYYNEQKQSKTNFDNFSAIILLIGMEGGLQRGEREW